MFFLLTRISFPNGGMASANRVSHLCRALSCSGVSVKVLTPFSDSGRQEMLVIDGIEYRSLCDAPKCAMDRKISLWIRYPLRVMRILRDAKSEDKILIYSYVSSVGLMIQDWILSLLMRIPIAAEECEYPYSILVHASRLKQFVESRIVPLFYNGIVCISQNLKDYYANRVRKSCKSICVPMTVDWDLFANVSHRKVFDFDYIAYTGAMRREGGGVDVLVRSFALIADKYPNLHLVLIGKGDRELEEELLGICNLKDRIHFLFSGKVPRKEMPGYICNAKILSMLPLQTKQQEGCFPTKLGEYLASGVPTVVSKVGNPAGCLSNRENVYFVPPNDPQTTADTFDEILSNYSAAQSIGRNGQEFAHQNFHYANFSKRLAEWYYEVMGESEIVDA